MLLIWAGGMAVAAFLVWRASVRRRGTFGDAKFSERDDGKSGLSKE
jgi:hypothetical protein